MAKKSFFTSIALIFLALLVGGAVFYQYNFLPQKITPVLNDIVSKFQEKKYQEVLSVWQEMESRFNEAGLKQYPNIFAAPAAEID